MLASSKVALDIIPRDDAHSILKMWVVLDSIPRDDATTMMHIAFS